MELQLSSDPRRRPFAQSMQYPPYPFVVCPTDQHVDHQESQAQVVDRVQPIETANMARLAGSVHPMARPEADQGLVDNSRVLQGMSLNFKRSTQQEANLKGFARGAAESRLAQLPQMGDAGPVRAKASA